MKMSQGEFLLDLAALIRRHPSQVWMKLARMLEKEKSRSQIVSFLQGLSVLGDTTVKVEIPRGSEQKPKPRVVKGQDRKADDIEKFELKLAQTPIADLRKIAEKTGLRVSTKDSKKRLVERIVRTSKLKMPALKGKRTAGVPLRRTRDYGQWARIILGRTEQSKPGK